MSDELCAMQLNPDSAGGRVYLTHARVWFELNNWLERSVTKVPEYLLWDDGDLWRSENGSNRAEVNEYAAWIGSGWPCLFQYNRETANPLEYEDLHTHIDKRAKNLFQRLKIRGSSDNITVTLLQERGPEEGKRDIAGVLSRYLPRYWAPDYGRFLPYPRSLFGPISWNGLRHDRFTDLERAMILESWLTLWPGSTGLRLQPASLTLAYWAARVLDLPHNESPRAFVDGHDWDGWFGGRFYYNKHRTGD